MKKAIQTISLIVGILMVFLGFGMVYTYAAASFVDSGTTIRFQTAQGTDNLYKIGDTNFIHKSSTTNIANINYQEKDFSIINDKPFNLDKYLIVEFKGQDYGSKASKYQFYFTNNSMFDVSFNDNQQKLINNDKIKVQVCNKANVAFNGGFTVAEEYSTGEKKLFDIDGIVFARGCKEYLVSANFGVLGKDTVRVNPFINMNDISVTQENQYVTVFTCKNNIGEEYDSLEVCPTGEEIIDSKKDNRPVNVAKTVTYKIYDSNSYVYPYIVVQEIKERVGIDCTTSKCPYDFECVSVEYQSKMYNVCNKPTIKPVVTQNEYIPNFVKLQYGKYLVTGLIMVIVGFIFIGGYYYAKKK